MSASGSNRLVLSENTLANGSNSTLTKNLMNANNVAIQNDRKNTAKTLKAKK